MSFLVSMGSSFVNYVSENKYDMWRTYNAVSAGLVFKDYFNNPTANPVEYLVDVSVHASSAGLLKDTPLKAKICAAALDVFRLGLIYSYSGQSAIPMAFNYIDAVNHGINLIVVGSLIYQEIMKKQQVASSQ